MKWHLDIIQVFLLVSPFNQLHLRKIKACDYWNSEVAVRKHYNFMILLSIRTILCYGNMVVVSKYKELKWEIMMEAYNAHYSNHLKNTKMFQDLRKHFSWICTSCDVIKYVQHFLTCQQVKIENRQPSGPCNHSDFITKMKTNLLSGRWWPPRLEPWSIFLQSIPQAKQPKTSPTIFLFMLARVHPLREPQRKMKLQRE